MSMMLPSVFGLYILELPRPQTVRRALCQRTEDVKKLAPLSSPELYGYMKGDRQREKEREKVSTHAEGKDQPFAEHTDM